MGKTSDYIVKRLTQWGVKRVFGYPGDAINPVIAALDRAQNSIEFVQARHEEMCAFMACAHAKFTGEIGVCLSTAGPGAIHLLNGLYDAKMDNQPVLAIVGQQPRHALGTNYLQDVDLAALFKDVAHEYVNVASTPEQVRHLIDRSIRIAYSERTVTCLILPHDVQSARAEEEPEREAGQSFSGAGYSAPRIVPKRSELERAATILNAGEKVAMLVGAGALHAHDEVLQVARTTGAGVAKALLGKAVLEDSLPFVTGSIGLLGTPASVDLMTKCDTLFVVGSNFPYAEYLPKPGSVRAVQIDIDARNISLRYPMDVGLVGDCRDTLGELLPLIKQKSAFEWRQFIEASVQKSWQILEAQAAEEGKPVNPQSIFARLSDNLPDDAIVTADSGTSTVWFARHLKMRRGMMASVSGGLASMGCSIPYAVAAKFAYPGRPVIACCGDGAMQMAGNSELLTIARYWRDWLDPRMTILVLKNNDLNFVTWEMRAMEGERKFLDSQALPDFHYAEFAKSLGLGGYTISSPEETNTVLSLALSSDRPTVIEIIADANIPPVPPKVSMAQVKSMAASQMKADPEGSKPFWGSVAQIWHSVFHR